MHKNLKDNIYLTLTEFIEQVYCFKPIMIYNNKKTFSFYDFSSNKELITFKTTYDDYNSFVKIIYKTDEFLNGIQTILRKEKILKLKSKVNGI